MKIVGPLASLVLLGLLVLPADAQARPTDRRVPVDVALVGGGGPSTAPLQLGPACVRRLADQANGGCLEASSTPTFGRLFPYPGTNNAFSGAAFVGGGQNNQATGAVATVAGGLFNTASGLTATIGGGTSNTASNGYSAVGGGAFNRATGYASTVGGGGGIYFGNAATGMNATVAGGGSNSANGDFATVGGGWANRAAGRYSLVPGGYYNTAWGSYSFAAGRRAIANHAGSFVWGDSQDRTKHSSTADEFNVYASGGARFFSNSAATTGVLLAPGGGSWTAVSSRDMKENVEPVNVKAVLERVLEVPISTWNYREQADSIRHMGPMAQDFYAAFELGLGETTIDTIDPDGVALAAIQGLHALVEEKDKRISELEARLERLEALVAESAGR